MKNINPTTTKSWKKLQIHFNDIKNIKILDLFLKDKNRFLNFSSIFQDQILVDFSKNRINQKTLKYLYNLANEMDLENAILDMFSGKKINYTENCEVLHIALRNKSKNPIFLDGENIMLDIHYVLHKMKIFSEKIITGKWKGYTGKKITDIVNIGIGGSNLGPEMVTEALRVYKNHLNIHFISNIDGTNITEILKKINAEKTIFLISSKTFTTRETISNAQSVKDWFLKFSKNTKFMSKHFIAISANEKEAKKFGIISENIFKFWKWVGGRYSLWSAVGLSIMLSIGYANFDLLLNGAYEMDQHFLNTKIQNNIPIILALIGIWYNNFFKSETEAILPYDEYMHKFTAYLQQSNMESNGKYIDRNGIKVNYQTGPIIWGERGTNAQHSFYQLIHQGTKLIPCDFIIPIITHNPIMNHHIQLLSNFFAQTKALAFGTSNLFSNNIFFENKKIESKDASLPFKFFEGNRPSNSILLKKITPFTLGALIAMYEHKIFVQGIILNIFSFDQWGVELGKKLANSIYYELKNNYDIKNHDNSTNNLIKFYKLWKKN